VRFARGGKIESLESPTSIASLREETERPGAANHGSRLGGHSRTLAQVTFLGWEALGDVQRDHASARAGTQLACGGDRHVVASDVDAGAPEARELGNRVSTEMSTAVARHR
jgi:hypothetical protein